MVVMIAMKALGIHKDIDAVSYRFIGWLLVTEDEVETACDCPAAR